MLMGLGLIALGISIAMLGNQASKHSDQAPATSPTSESVSYRSINKQELGADVVEFFWYGCSHCLRLETSLRSQSFHEQVANTTIDGQVQYKASFARVPAAFNDEWTLDARLFYALDGLGMDGDGHYKMMSIIGSNRPKTRGQMLSLLDDEILPSIRADKLLEWTLSAQELDAAMFSPGVDRKIQEGIELGKKVRLTGVPVMVVGGEKVVSLGTDVNYETMGPSVLSLLRPTGN